MIDLHCHLLPGIDDGPENIDGTLALARAAAAAGTRTIVATPHVDHRWGVVPSIVAPSAAFVTAALKEAGVELEVLAGGEIALSRLIELREHELDAIRLGDGPYLLIESPHSAAAGDFHTFVRTLLERGHAIVLAHPERCPGFQRRPERLAELVEAGALCSITSSALAGRFGSTARELALDMLAGGLVHDVASDSHDALRRSPELLAGIYAAERDLPGLAAHAHWLTHEAPAAILAGAQLPPRPPLPQRAGARGGRRRRRRRLF
ncbi:MAG TPA: CpsB/CapC family capsule biosynthesis tyrosine phosphatase [Solirubrobacteraceae bacterium]